MSVNIYNTFSDISYMVGGPQHVQKLYIVPFVLYLSNETSSVDSKDTKRKKSCCCQFSPVLDHLFRAVSGKAFMKREQ